MSGARRPTELGDLLARGAHAGAVIFRGISGSQAYGLATPESDQDERGVFVLPLAEYASLEPPLEHIQDERGDVAYYALRKFLVLLAGANPNALELLFLPDDCILESTPAFEILCAHRDLFVTELCLETHVGYARAQVKRARGLNKWINNPQPEVPPTREEFCWVVLGPWPGEVVGSSPVVPPLRPRRLADVRAESGLDLAEYHCAKMEHMGQVYRIYHYGKDAKGVFRGGQIVCESIPITDEFTRMRGLLLYDDAGFQQALKDHKHYWAWRRDRNEARWRTQESGEIDYDAKNMMHTFRLVRSAAAILRHGAPRVRFDGDERAFLMDVRAGRFTYDELVDRVETEVDELGAAAVAAGLPPPPDPQRVDELLREITETASRDRSGRA